MREVAVHKQSEGRRLRIVDSAHLDGVAGRDGAVCRPEIAAPTVPASSPPPSLLRPLAEYEAAIGGNSRRLHVRAFRAEKQEHWFAGLESAFTTFGGVSEEVLMDNPRALVVHHDAVSRSVQFNDKLIAFAKHWGFRPRACAPYRARTKGKTENGVGYVKKNAIAGHSFASWEAFEAHLAKWEYEVANVRIHGTTGEAPIARFERDEAHRLRPLGGRPSFGSLRELTRVVGNDCAVEIDTNRYSVPWRLIGERVAVTVAAGEVHIRHARGCSS
jgi:hypothetical protein